MPWLETAPVEQRERFIDDPRLGLYDMTELCARYAVSRKTGYKWLARYDAGGRPALRDRESGAPPLPAQDSRSPWRSSLLTARRRAPGLGTGEAAAVARAAASRRDLARHQHGRRSPRPARPREETPTAATAAAPRRRPAGDRARPTTCGPPTSKASSAPAIGIYCYPLTVTDQHTRYLLACHGLLSTTGHRRAAHLRSPLPRVRAAAGDAHRQRRAVRLHLAARAHVAQRVVAAPRHSAPAHPAGASPAERRPRAHAQDPEARRHSAAPRARSPPSNAPSTGFARSTTTSGPISFSAAGRQARAIAPRPARTPASLPTLEYPDHFLVKRVTNAGTIRFKTRLLYLSTALKQHRIGLEEVDDGIWSLYFCNVLLGRIDERKALVTGQLGVTHVPG